MKLLHHTFLVILFFSTVTMPARAQQKSLTDSIASKIEWLGKQKTRSTLFVHFDKNIYSNTENAWFTGYLVKTNNSGVHNTLSLALIRNDDRSVLAESKYLMDKGLAFGSLFLPDSLPTGDYSFVCYTNLLVNGYPDALFVQPVTIKSADTKSFTAKLSLTDSIKPGMDTAFVLLKAYTKDIVLVKKAPVKYFIGNRSHPLYSDTLITDIYGEVKIPIPLKKITPANNILQAEISSNNSIKNFSIKLPVYEKENIVKFYPEGGSLVESIANIIGWEVKNNEGEPVAVNAALYKDDRLLQTIKTNAFGMGKFLISPEKDSRYYVKLYDGLQDISFMLPVAIQNAPAITIPEALATDTAFVHINTQGIAAKFLLMLHDYSSVFVNSPVITSGKTTLIKIPLTEVPRGLTTLTLLDSLGRPLAERLFFAHFDKRDEVNISTDSAVYSPRQKVTVAVKISDAGNNPLRGLVSIACVQNNRLDIQKTMNIENYTYLTNDLVAFPFKKNMMGKEKENKEFLDLLLLIKGWRRYTWYDVEKQNATDTMVIINSLAFTGKVILNEKTLKKPVSLNLKKFITPKLSEVDFISTDSIGRFELMPEKITSEPNRKFEISVNNERKNEYAITVNDPYKAMNKILAASLSFQDYSQRNFTQNSQSSVFKNDEVIKTLKTVEVSTKKDTRDFFLRTPGTNICGDYVCSYGVLNCTNHPNERFEPVVGRSYVYRSSIGSRSTSTSVYEGCTALTQEVKNEYLFLMDGIYNKKEFYVANLTQADITDAQYLSTLYWNYAITTNKNGITKLEFYTSDIPGKFRIVIQGVTSANVVYGEHFFEVKSQ